MNGWIEGSHREREIERGSREAGERRDGSVCKGRQAGRQRSTALICPEGHQSSDMSDW